MTWLPFLNFYEVNEQICHLSNTINHFYLFAQSSQVHPNEIYVTGTQVHIEIIILALQMHSLARQRLDKDALPASTSTKHYLIAVLTVHCHGLFFFLLVNLQNNTFSVQYETLL